MRTINAEGARPQLILAKRLYNDGTGTDWVGDVTAAVTIGGTAQSPIAYLQVYRYTSEDGSQAEGLYNHNFSTVPVLDTPYSASIAWNGSTVTGTFNGESITYTPITTINPARHSWCRLRAQVYDNYVNGVGREATIEGFFDNIRVNGALYDDFSGPKIDETKWREYEFVREIDGGKLRSEVRSTTASTTTIQSNLTMLMPLSAKAIEAKVRLTSYNNPSAANCRADVSGRFFNDGSTGGGYTGDYLAFTYLGGNGTSPVAGWAVARYSGAGSNSVIGVASGTFTTPISLGVDYTLSVDWDGSKFVFKIDSETVEYAPVVSTVLPANQPVKGLDTFITNNAGKEATIAALTDDVRIVESSSLYADFGSNGIWMYNGSTWSQTTSSNPETMVVSGSTLYGDFGSSGIWMYNGTTWSQTTPSNPQMMTVSGPTLYGAFSGAGIWKWDGSSWSQTASSNPETMVVSGSTLYGDFGSSGIWMYNGTTWSQTTPSNPQMMTVSGSTLYGAFSGAGIWKWDGSSWSQTASGNPEAILASGSTLYGDFGSSGIWMYNGTTWSQTTPSNPQMMTVSGSTLYGAFSGAGIWKWDGSSWSQITPNDPASMVVGY